MRTLIKKIIVDEFSKLVRNIEKDFEVNYRRKINNFLLRQMDERITASMVFVSSFESKSGFAIESCAKKITRLRFGDENVPDIVNPRGLRIPYISGNGGQVVITDVDTYSPELRGKIASFRARNEARGRGAEREESRTTNETIKKELLPLAKEFKTENICIKPVDLAFFDGTDWNICELKAGGDLDSSNAPSNVEKLLTIYVDMGVENCKAYFVALYNKDGEGSIWKGAVKKHLNYPSMFLIGSDFWNKILPEGITFNEFTAIYKEALNEIDLNQRVNDMIEKILVEGK